ncbi:MAG: hypothetical protein ACTH6N_08615 [Brachybacterium tyrofermentans]|uniref:hypothetical protein n=1 Tax=Brachybacterium tyrofermentans TaxID=47848 RepID=UPI0018672811|nr:hypothetical protein [Brachybacterium tyrofermentans]
MNVENPKLQALVADRKGDRSYEQLAALSGGRLSRARIQQIATRDMKAFPDAATLAGLAQALDVPVQEVVLASARSLGLEVRGGASGDALLVPGGRLLSTPAQDALLTMARELSKAGARDDQREAEVVAGDAQPDGITTAVPEARPEKEQYPWEKAGFDLAAMHGPNRGKDMRRRQDEEAERPDAPAPDDPA